MICLPVHPAANHAHLDGIRTLPLAPVAVWKADEDSISRVVQGSVFPKPREELCPLLVLELRCAVAYESTPTATWHCFHKPVDFLKLTPNTPEQTLQNKFWKILLAE